MRKTGLVAAGLLVALAGLSWAASKSSTSQELTVGFYTQVSFEDPVPTGQIPVKGSEECTTGCSLAKHAVPDFTAYDFEKTLAAYGEGPAQEASESLETLLFYGSRTVQLLEEVGVAKLPKRHLSFLKKELARDHALVSLRLVDADGKVRVSYGPTLVPLGTKQHLAPAGKDLQAMEFNGTVMRTGVNYLWSRY